jgi:hypothetical protein
MFSHVVMALCRVTDPAIARRPKEGEAPEDFNLSVELLVWEVEKNDPKFGAKIRADLDSMKQDIERLHRLRNKQIAHSDYDHRRVRARNTFPDRVSYQFIDEFGKRLHELVNRVESHYFDASTIYDYPMTAGFGDGDSLVWLLRLAFENGNPRLKPPEIRS